MKKYIIITTLVFISHLFLLNLEVQGETCDYENLDWEEFEFKIYDELEVLLENPYRKWRKEKSVVVYPLPYQIYKGKKGKLNPEAEWNSIHSRQWQEAILEDNCEKIYTDSDLSGIVTKTEEKRKFSKRVDWKPEQGEWKVVKYSNGTNGAHFENKNIELRVFRRPGANENSIRIFTRGDKYFINGDQIILSFDSPFPAYNEFTHYWDDVAVETSKSDSGKITTASIAVSSNVIKEMKEKKELYVYGGAKEDIEKRHGYAVFYRVPLRGSASAISKAIITDENFSK